MNGRILQSVKYPHFHGSPRGLRALGCEGRREEVAHEWNRGASGDAAAAPSFPVRRKVRAEIRPVCEGWFV